MEKNIKRILITGGSGFLGRNLALKLKNTYEVFLAARNNKNNKYAENLTGCKSLPLDVSNIESVRDVINEVKPNIIIHAAATKFVDLSEKYPMECVDVNVTGSQNVARVAIDKGVEYVLGISTDKASPPIKNIYGLSKSLMERLFTSLNGKSNTKFACVRYGNVAWSTGSVLTIWDKMIKETKLIKTTGPEMRRYFFTVDEAANLVLTALDNFEKVQGKILSREMKAATMIDIIKTWCELTDSNYEKIDGRPGDRLDEFLIGEDEILFTTEIELNNIIHYIIDLKNKSDNPIKAIISTNNCKKLTKSEIINILQNDPN